MPVSPGVMTVVASTSAPDPRPCTGAARRARIRRVPNVWSPAGRRGILTATATVDVPIPTTTTTSTTSTTIDPAADDHDDLTTIPTTTTTSTSTTHPAHDHPSTTTIAATTITTTTTAVAAASTVAPTTTLVVAPILEVLPPVPAPAVPLPRTGKASDLISYLGTSLLVAGIGIVGVASRRRSADVTR